MNRYGIDGLGVAFPEAYVDLADLAAARGVAPAKFTAGLGTVSMAVAGVEDDTVTLAARATADAFARSGVSPDEIGLCIVGTETAVDHSKPVSSFLQGLAGLPSTCRVYETKHACYGGTAGLMTALDWLASGNARGKKALIVCSDIARYGLGTPGEPTQGAGAVALIVGPKPRLVAIDAATVGTYSKHVFDFWRPIDSKDARVDGHYSASCYLDALRGAHAEHVKLAGADPNDAFGARLYHVPYGKMARKAHALLAELTGDAAPDASFERVVAPSLVLPSRIGNVYTGSLYLALASALACAPAPLDERMVSLFSYGSGSCAEMFRGRFMPGAQAGFASLVPRLDARRRLTVAEYEAMFRARDEERPATLVAPSGDPSTARFLGTDAGRRVYR
jgi:hydroxymethylglutaryl-CoA synthase